MNLKDACRRRALVKAYGEHRELIEQMRWIGRIKAVIEELPEGASLTAIIEGVEVKTLPKAEPIRMTEVPALYYRPVNAGPDAPFRRLPGVISVQFDLAQMSDQDCIDVRLGFRA